MKEFYGITIFNKKHINDLKLFLRDNRLYFEPSSYYEGVHFEIKCSDVMFAYIDNMVSEWENTRWYHVKIRTENDKKVHYMSSQTTSEFNAVLNVIEALQAKPEYEDLDTGSDFYIMGVSSCELIEKR